MSNTKTNLRLIFSLLMLLTTSAMAQNHAVEINIGGKGPAVDGFAFDTVRQVIGHAVANGVVDKFIVNNYGVEGGFSACAQTSARTKGFVAFVQQLHTIVPNPNTTFYSVRLATACTENVTFCAQDVYQCPDGSYVSRVPPTCNFTPCPSK
ncbi:MAG: hypothetical protein PHR16_10265 [Methylovulum sp.]|nr:hypothetical protein [Methylovulum sp.]